MGRGTIEEPPGKTERSHERHLTMANGTGGAMGNGRNRNGGSGRRGSGGTVTKRPRLTTPFVRENGELRPATWDEALSRAGAGFRRVIDEHGPEAVGMFSCSKSTNEMNYAAQKFARTVLGTNNIDSCNRT